MKTAQLLDQLDSLLRLGKRLQRDLLERQPAELSSVAALQALRVIDSEKNAERRTNTLIARHLGITEPSASSLIQTLLKLKLVVRTDAYNRRAKSLNLTGRGKEALNEGVKVWASCGQKLIGELSSHDSDLMFKAIDALNTYYDHCDHIAWIKVQEHAVTVPKTQAHWSAYKRAQVAAHARKRSRST